MTSIQSLENQEQQWKSYLDQRHSVFNLTQYHHPNPYQQKVILAYMFIWNNREVIPSQLSHDYLLGVITMIVRWGLTNFNLYEQMKITGLQTMLEMGELIIIMLEREYSSLRSESKLNIIQLAMQILYDTHLQQPQLLIMILRVLDQYDQSSDTLDQVTKFCQNVQHLFQYLSPFQKSIIAYKMISILNNDSLVLDENRQYENYIVEVLQNVFEIESMMDYGRDLIRQLNHPHIRFSQQGKSKIDFITSHMTGQTYQAIISNKCVKEEQYALSFIINISPNLDKMLQFMLSNTYKDFKIVKSTLLMMIQNHSPWILIEIIRYQIALLVLNSQQQHNSFIMILSIYHLVKNWANQGDGLPNPIYPFVNLALLYDWIHFNSSLENRTKIITVACFFQFLSQNNEKQLLNDILSFLQALGDQYDSKNGAIIQNNINECWKVVQQSDINFSLLISIVQLQNQQASPQNDTTGEEENYRIDDVPDSEMFNVTVYIHEDLTNMNFFSNMDQYAKWSKDSMLKEIAIVLINKNMDQLLGIDNCQSLDKLIEETSQLVSNPDYMNHLKLRFKTQFPLHYLILGKLASYEQASPALLCSILKSKNIHLINVFRDGLTKKFNFKILNHCIQKIAIYSNQHLYLFGLFLTNSIITAECGELIDVILRYLTIEQTQQLVLQLEQKQVVFTIDEAYIKKVLKSSDYMSQKQAIFIVSQYKITKLIINILMMTIQQPLAEMKLFKNKIFFQLAAEVLLDHIQTLNKTELDQANFQFLWEIPSAYAVSFVKVVNFLVENETKSVFQTLFDAVSQSRQQQKQEKFDNLIQTLKNLQANGVKKINQKTEKAFLHPNLKKLIGIEF